MTQGLCILGSTGSIGQNCLRVVDGLPDRFRVVALSAGKNLDVLATQVVKHHPEVVVVGAPEYRDQLRDRLKQHGYSREVKILGESKDRSRLRRTPRLTLSFRQVTERQGWWQHLKPCGLGSA